jgi:hypothetical protein
MPEDDPYEYDPPYDEDPYDYDADGYDAADEFSEPMDANAAASDDAYRTPPPHHADPHCTAPRQAAPIDLAGVRCMACGYNLTGSTITGNCPECGTPNERSYYASGQRPNPGLAIASMVLGIISIPTLCCCGGLLGVVGLPLGLVALMQLPNTPAASGARGMALAGVICSGVSITLTILWFGLGFIGSIP